jgi:lysozyme
MTYSQDCVYLNSESEGCRLTTYDDARPNYVLQFGDTPIGKLTIGKGHTGPDVHIGLVWTQAQADLQQAADLEKACEQMQALVKVPLTQGQTDCLTDFCFNVGSGKLKASTLLKLLNMGEYDAACNELYRVDEDGNQHGFIFAGGKVLAGLVKRRQAEQALWNK